MGNDVEDDGKLKGKLCRGGSFTSFGLERPLKEKWKDGSRVSVLHQPLRCASITYYHQMERCQEIFQIVYEVRQCEGESKLLFSGILGLISVFQHFHLYSCSLTRSPSKSHTAVCLF